MQLNTELLKTVREADYDPKTRMVKLTIVCRPDDLVVADGASTVDLDLDQLLLTINQIDRQEAGATT